MVGGSNYYAQALVSDSLMDVQEPDDDICILDKLSFEGAKQNGGRRTSSDDMPVAVDASTAHARLAEVDPESAERLHPNDVRRVRRYLEIFDSTGERPSDIFKRKRTMKKFVSQFDALGCQTVFVALKCDSKVLDDVLRERVYSMIEKGLVEELEEFARRYGVESSGGERGDVRQAIGYAEWKPYLRAKVQINDLPRGDEELASMRDEAIRSTIRHTRRLSRRQQSRLQTFAKQYSWPVGFIDVTEPLRVFCTKRSDFEDSWTSNVVHRALKLCEEGINVDTETSYISRGLALATAPRDDWFVRSCEVCRKTLRGEFEWGAHVNGRRHRKACANARKRQRNDFGTKHPSLDMSLDR